MPSLKSHTHADRVGEVDAEDHARDEAGRRGPPAARAGRDRRRAPVRERACRGGRRGGGCAPGGESHPLLDQRPVKKIGLVVLTSDRGLAGGFNANIFRGVQRFVVEQSAAAGAAGHRDLCGRQEGPRLLPAPQELGRRARVRGRGRQRGRGTRAGSRADDPRAVPDRAGRRRLPGLQRVQVRDPAARGDRAAAAAGRWSPGGRRRGIVARRADRLPLRAGQEAAAGRAPAAVRRSRRSTARCSSRSRRSSARA